MAVISDISDEGSNGGGDRSKKELNKNQKEETRLPIALHLPHEIVEKIALQFERINYLDLSLFARCFLDVLRADDFFATLSRRGSTNTVLFSSISVLQSDPPSWYFLKQNLFPFEPLPMTRIHSLPPMRYGCAVVTIGYNIYLIRGLINDVPVSTVTVIDCRFNTSHSLPNMLKERCFPAAGVMDRNIYVFGGIPQRGDEWIEVLDVNNMAWAFLGGPGEYGSYWRGGPLTQCVVIEDEIFMSDMISCLAYRPSKEDKWRSFASDSALTRSWRKQSCVIGNALYCIDINSIVNPIKVYNLKEDTWSYLRNVPTLPHYNYGRSRVANFGGNLLILVTKDTESGGEEVWRVEIVLETREGEMWGFLQPALLVLRDRRLSIELVQTVTR